jgi:hypothetical protein
MKNLQKGFVVPLIIAIVAVLTIGGGIYYSQKKSEVPSNTISGSNSTASSKNVSDEMSGWKTYRNDQLGFEFKYPSDWQYRILNEKDIDDIVQLFSPESYAEAQKGDKDGATNFMDFRSWKTDAYIKGLQGNSVTIAGKSAIDTGWTLSAMGGLPVKQIRFFVEPPVTIEMNALSETKAIEEKILSTLKFTK